MAAPTPIHRDPETDGDDYGCVGRRARKGNTEIAVLVAETNDQLRSGDFADVDELADHVRAGLEEIESLYDCGSCDTIVKENVFAALRETIVESALDDVEEADIYFW